MRRIVVTGLGLVTPLGADVETVWANILAGKSGAGPITRFDASDQKCRIACEVKPKDHPYGFNADLRVVLARPELRERLNVIGLEVMGTGTPEDFGAFLQLELGKWAKWVKDAGIQPE